MELATRFHVVWDTNGYYRELGVKPDATRMEIRKAYQRLKGWLSPRLTFIMAQLLDREVRSKYDRTPLGSLFFDEHVEKSIRDRMVREVTDLRRQGMISEEEYEALHIDPEIDPEENLSIDDGSSLREAIVSSPELKWDWSYYLWNSDCDDINRLRKWQELLISALGERKEHHQLSIGFVGDMESACEVRMVGYRRVVFLNDREQPTEALAELAASRVIASF